MVDWLDRSFVWLFVRITNTSNLLNKTDSEFLGNKNGVLCVFHIGFIPESELQCFEQVIEGADQ
jgi:hypothetical protein